MEKLNILHENNPDGMEELLAILDGNPATYREWAEYYFEKEVPIKPVEHIYQQKSLTDELVKGLNDNISIEDLQADIEEIGYPN